VEEGDGEVRAGGCECGCRTARHAEVMMMMVVVVVVDVRAGRRAVGVQRLGWRRKVGKVVGELWDGPDRGIIV
jgi:hypothetical protein